MQWSMIRDRLKEEQEILVREMHGYLSFYKDTVMPLLEKKKKNISGRLGRIFI